MNTPSPAISAIICSRNPRPHFLAATLEGLRCQALPKESWELLIIDDASAPPITPNLSWHPNARIVRYDNHVGINAARTRGSREAKGELIIWVDDDNVLDPEYLRHALEISAQWPQLGVWGGDSTGVFEEPPAEWTKAYWGWLAIRAVPRDLWSNVPFDPQTEPYGAGMCIRRKISLLHVQQLEASPARRAIGRSGTSLGAGEDTDMVYTASQAGYGTGLFARLKLGHLMPNVRLEEPYLLRLVEDMTSASLVLQHIWGRPPFAPPSLLRRALKWHQLRRVPERTRRFEAARERGLQRGRALVAQLEKAKL